MNEHSQAYQDTKQQALETMKNGNIQAYLSKLLALHQLNTRLLHFENA